MSKVKIQGNASGTGVVTLTAPNTNTDRTITLPDEDITLGGGVDGIVSTANATAITIDSSEQVKIGDSATDVTSKLTVSGNASRDVATFMYDGSAGTYLDIDCNAADGVVELRADARTGVYPPLTFKTGAAERMRIDSAGRVTMPYQPSFSAFLNANLSQPYGVSLVLGTWTQSHDTGNNYDPVTRRFTAPVSGVYHFDCNVGTSGGQGAFNYLSAEINVNGVRTRNGGWEGSGSTSYSAANYSGNIYLNASEYVELGCETSKTFTMQAGSLGQTLFSGYLIG